MPVDRDVLTEQVDLDHAVGFGDHHRTDLALRSPRRRQRGDPVRAETKEGLDDVFNFAIGFTRAIGQANRHRGHLFEESNRKVEVVDQQITADAGLDTLGHRRVSCRPEVHRRTTQLERCTDRRVEPFEKTAHDRCVLSLGLGEERVHLDDRVGERFLHQHWRSVRHHLESQLVMELGGCRDDDGVDARQVQLVREPARVPFGDGAPCRRIAVVYPCKLGLRGGCDHARMEGAHRAGPDEPNPQCGLHRTADRTAAATVASCDSSTAGCTGRDRQRRATDSATGTGSGRTRLSFR